MLYLALGLILLTVACSGYYNGAWPTKGVYDFVIEEPGLQKIWLDAAQEWTDAGLVVAAQVTVNTNPKGIKVKWAVPGDMLRLCHKTEKDYPQGNRPAACSNMNQEGKNRFDDTLWLSWTQDKVRLRLIALHELIHVIVPTNQHLPDGVIGIMSRTANSEYITDADLEFLSELTEVV